MLTRTEISAEERECRVGFLTDNINLIQNSQAVKTECGPQKGYGEK